MTGPIKRGFKVKIENEIFNFAKTLNPQQLGLGELQIQYLSYLTAGDTLEQLVVRLLQNGWLVNFQELYSLVEKLVKNSAISNINIINYFKNFSSPPISSGGSVSSEGAPSKEMIRKLLELPFFRSLPQELSNLILQKSLIKKFPINAFICKNGDTDRNLYVLLNGQAAIYKDKKFISTIGSKGIFGEASFLTGSTKSTDILTQQTCEVLVVPYQSTLLDPILKQNVAHEIVKRFWIQNALAQSDFFKKIPADCLDALTFSGRIITLKNEQILFKENEIGHAAYLVIQGQMKIVKDGKIISTLNQGGFLGEISLTMTNGIRVASAFANGEATLLEITRDNFYRLLSKNLFLAKEIQNLAMARMDKNQKAK